MRSKSFPRCFAGEAGVEPAMCRLPHSLVFSAPPIYCLGKRNAASLNYDVNVLARTRPRCTAARQACIGYLLSTHAPCVCVRDVNVLLCWWPDVDSNHGHPGGLVTARLLCQLSYPAFCRGAGGCGLLMSDAPPRQCAARLLASGDKRLITI